MTYAQQVRQHFKKHADAPRAQAMKQYLRGKFDFFGISAPQRKELIRSFWKNYGPPALSGLHETITELWAMPEREMQHTAIEICHKLVKKVDKNHIKTLEHMLTNKQWWDTVDLTASNLTGSYFKRYPEKILVFIPKWQQSDDFWLNRSAILFQLKYKNQTNTDLLAQSILLHTHSKEFFIQKAIGWALREYSKTDPEWVRSFILNHKMANLSIKEGSKYL